MSRNTRTTTTQRISPNGTIYRTTRTTNGDGTGTSEIDVGVFSSFFNNLDVDFDENNANNAFQEFFQNANANENVPTRAGEEDPPPPYNPNYGTPENVDSEESSFSPLLEPKIDSLDQVFFDIPRNVKFVPGGKHPLQPGTLYNFFIRDMPMGLLLFKGTVNKETGYVKLENCNGQVVLEIRKSGSAGSSNLAKFTVFHRNYQLCIINMPTSSSNPLLNLDVKDPYHKKGIFTNASISPGDFTFSRNKYSAPIAQAHMKLDNKFDGSLSFSPGSGSNENLSKIDQSIIISVLITFVIVQNKTPQFSTSAGTGVEGSIHTETIIVNGAGASENDDSDSDPFETICAWIGAILLLVIIGLLGYWVMVAMEKSACRKKKFRYIGIIECTPEIWNS